MMKRVWMSCCVLLTGLFAGCVSTGGQAKPEAPAVTAITEAQRGQTVTLPLGSKAQVRLPENPSTGYCWFYRNSAADVCRINNDHFAPPSPPSPPNICGAGGTRVIDIEMTAPGKSVLTFDYLRPWEKNQPPAETIIFTVRTP